MAAEAQHAHVHLAAAADDGDVGGHGAVHQTATLVHQRALAIERQIVRKVMRAGRDFHDSRYHGVPSRNGSINRSAGRSSDRCGSRTARARSRSDRCRRPWRSQSRRAVTTAIWFKNANNASERHAITTRNGSVAVSFLPPGQYTITVHHQGFASSEVRDVELSINDQPRLGIQLKILPSSESVTVVSDASR